MSTLVSAHLEGWRREMIMREGRGRDTGTQSTITGVAGLIRILLETHIPWLRCARSSSRTTTASSNTTSGCQNVLDWDLLGDLSEDLYNTFASLRADLKEQQASFLRLCLRFVLGDLPDSIRVQDR